MANTYFNFKQFSIIQEKSAMKVGTDGVLLGAWANCSNAAKILDIGTGTGLIALMLAQRSNANIDAVEIDPDAAGEARLNVKNSSWADRITVFENSIQEYAKNTTKNYDLIITNPPFFNQSFKAKNTARTQARHTEMLSTIDLFSVVSKCLHTNGIFCAVIPSENLNDFVDTAKSFALFCTKTTWLKPTPSKVPKRVLIEFSRINSDLCERTFVIEDGGRHQYSEEYKNLTKDFYLSF